MLFKNKPIYFTKAQSPRQSRQFDFKNKPKCFTKATQLGKLVFCAAVHCRANQVISCVPIKTFRVPIKTCPVFQSRHLLRYNQDNVCVPIKMFRMFQSRHFVISNKDDSSSFHIITSSNHIYNESPFCPKITKKNFDTTFTPPPKVAQTRK